MTRSTFRTEVFSLANRIYPMVYRLIGNQLDAEDAIQDIMVKLWDKRMILKNVENKSAYVFRVAHNHCLDQLKKKSLNLATEEPQVNDLKSNRQHQELEHRELIEVIKSIIKKCPYGEAEVLLMRDIDQMEYDEIAEVTGQRIDNIRVIISRTRKYVRNELKKKYNYEIE